MAASDPERLALVPIHPGSGDVAVVFVHGLDGSPVGTFTGSDGPWADVFEQDRRAFDGAEAPPPLSTFASYTLDYRVVYKGNNTIEHAAQQVAELLQASDLFRRYNRVFFVTHSLGGILIKRTLLLYDDDGYDTLLNRVAGVFFMGVPAAGSPVANLAESTVGAFLTSIIGKRYRVVTDLRPDTAAAFLGSLERSWTAFVNRRRLLYQQAPPRIFCVNETEKIGNAVQAVPELYSQACLGERSSMTRNHLELVKPAGRDNLHDWVRERIRQSMQDLDRWPLFGVTPTRGSLADVVADFQRQHERPADKSGIVAVPERIEFSTPESRDRAARLLLRPEPYAGSTAAQLFQRVAGRNACVSVEVADRNRTVRIAVAPDVVSCPGDRVVCPGVACPG